MDHNARKRAFELLDAQLNENLAPKTAQEIRAWFIGAAHQEEKFLALWEHWQKQIVESDRKGTETDADFVEIAIRLGFPDREYAARPVPRPTARKTVPLYRRVLTRAAAVVIPVLIVTGIFFLLNRHPEMEIASTEHVQEVFLPDSTHVSVSPGSTVHYRESADTRHVELSGEAFFKVSHDTLKPFLVSTDHVRLRVLGTHFNVVDHSEATSNEVSLYEGSVHIETAGIENTLAGGERLTYDSATGAVDISIIPASEMIARGYKPRLKFDHSSLGEILEALSVRHGVQIEGRAGNDTSGGDLTVDLENMTLERALQILQAITHEQLTYRIEKTTESRTD